VTIEQFSRQTYEYPVLWYLGATVVAFVAAILFWQRGSASAEAKVPGVPFTWKLTGAGAVFVAVIFVFHIVNPLKPFFDYKKILIISSNQDNVGSSGEVSQWKIDRSMLSTAEKSVPFDDNLHIELVRQNGIYQLTRELTDNSFNTSGPIPKGMYSVRLNSFTTGKSVDFSYEVK
jgi:hypothetical protein